jgi:hypothetical protein
VACEFTTPAIDVSATDAYGQIDTSIGSSCYLVSENSSFISPSSSFITGLQAKFRSGIATFRIRGVSRARMVSLSLFCHCASAGIDGVSVIHRVSHEIPYYLRIKHTPKYMIAGVSAGSSAIQAQITDFSHRVLSSSFMFRITMSGSSCSVYNWIPVLSSDGVTWLFPDLIFDSHMASVSSCCLTLSLSDWTAVQNVSTCIPLAHGPVGLSFSNSSIVEIQRGGRVSPFVVTVIRGYRTLCEWCSGDICVSAVDNYGKNVLLSGVTCQSIVQSSVIFDDIAISSGFFSSMYIIAQYRNFSWFSEVIHVAPFAASISFRLCEFPAVASSTPLHFCTVSILDQNGEVYTNGSFLIHLNLSSQLCSLNANNISSSRGSANLSGIAISGSAFGVRLVASVFDGRMILAESKAFNVHGHCNRVSFVALSSSFVVGSAVAISVAVRDSNSIFCGDDNSTAARFRFIQGIVTHDIGVVTSINGIASITFVVFGSIAPADISVSANGGPPNVISVRIFPGVCSKMLPSHQPIAFYRGQPSTSPVVFLCLDASNNTVSALNVTALTVKTISPCHVVSHSDAVPHEEHVYIHNLLVSCSALPSNQLPILFAFGDSLQAEIAAFISDFVPSLKIIQDIAGVSTFGFAMAPFVVAFCTDVFSCDASRLSVSDVVSVSLVGSSESLVLRRNGFPCPCEYIMSSDSLTIDDLQFSSGSQSVVLNVSSKLFSSFSISKAFPVANYSSQFMTLLARPYPHFAALTTAEYSVRVYDSFNISIANVVIALEIYNLDGTLATGAFNTSVSVSDVNGQCNIFISTHISGHYELQLRSSSMVLQSSFEVGFAVPSFAYVDQSPTIAVAGGVLHPSLSVYFLDAFRNVLTHPVNATIQYVNATTGEIVQYKNVEFFNGSISIASCEITRASCCVAICVSSSSVRACSDAFDVKSAPPSAVSVSVMNSSSHAYVFVKCSLTDVFGNLCKISDVPASLWLIINSIAFHNQSTYAVSLLGTWSANLSFPPNFLEGGFQVGFSSKALNIDGSSMIFNTSGAAVGASITLAVASVPAGGSLGRIRVVFIDGSAQRCHR